MRCAFQLGEESRFVRVDRGSQFIGERLARSDGDGVAIGGDGNRNSPR
jgi:hypothetical protein